MATLVVASPGLRARREQFQRLRSQVEAIEPGVQWEFVEHRQHYLSFGSPAAKALDIVARIDRIWSNNPGSFDRIVFVGYSAGAILVRLAYLISAGVYANRPGPGKRLRGQPARTWHEAVAGFVLIAGVNAGWNPFTALKPVVWLSDAIGLQRRLFSGNLISGSYFVTNVRLDWMDLMPRLGQRAPRIVQVLGTEDSLMGDADSTDVTQFPNAEQVLVEGARHLSIMDRSQEIGDAVATVFRGRSSAASNPRTSEESTETPSSIVFIVHGIRDSRRTWPDDAGEKVKAIDASAQVLTASYGYLSALRFVLPGNRRKRARWLCDQYTRMRAKHPQVPFHFIGHSNGTYTLGRSLVEVHGMRFDRVVLMGSVLPREYPWQAMKDSGQAGHIENHCSRRDWPVAWLCSTLRAIGMKDLGTGGFEGFDDGAVFESRWYPEGHGSPMSKDEYLDRIAAFVCGRVPQSWDDTERLPGPGPVWLSSPRWFPLVVGVLLLALACLGTWAAVTHEWVWYGAAVAAVLLLVLIVADMG